MSDAKKCNRCGKFYDIYGQANNAVGFRFVNRECVREGKSGAIGVCWMQEEY